ncbi:hypothetical protein M011DRAFT_88033 [Sporormia fimetaria CBS 119925]|uniref:Uncharacterized protein n=1 Tax=Sporormia fimetaria CBS 119925 TaxID=1340428 RepID=A0A6A6VAL0_9PLEO|nr:hypothetical protein M011DRAFT_88033 [Sporormia fimetaria CBS 119925]
MWHCRPSGRQRQHAPRFRSSCHLSPAECPEGYARVETHQREAAWQEVQRIRAVRQTFRVEAIQPHDRPGASNAPLQRWSNKKRTQEFGESRVETLTSPKTHGYGFPFLFLQVVVDKSASSRGDHRRIRLGTDGRTALQAALSGMTRHYCENESR